MPYGTYIFLFLLVSTRATEPTVGGSHDGLVDARPVLSVGDD